LRIPLLDLLRRNPLPAIGDLMDAANTCAQQLPKLVAALEAGDHSLIADLARETSRLESLSDDKKNEVRDSLPSGWLMPVDRRDALRLVSEVDAIADCAEDVGVLLTLRALELPADMKTPLDELVEQVLSTVAAATEVVDQFDALQLAAFEGPVAAETLELVRELARREHLADKVQDQCAKTLFRSEDEMSPVAVFMWNKVLNKIGDVANHAENVGDQFRLFVAGAG
jgi:predicted phosphate transport protein (TIGR00153 family)